MGTHDTTAAPAIAGVIDLDGTEQGPPAGPTAPGGSVRGFRAAGSTAPPATPSTEADKHVRAELHAGTDHPDTRRGVFTALTPLDHDATVVVYDNSRRDVVLTPEQPPARPRGGFTGADPTRAAQYVRPSVMRPFDKGIAEHPGQVLKIESAGPLAARPKDGLSDVHGGQAYSGGSTGTQRAGVGPGRNSFRIMPQPWDTLLVDTGGPAVTTSNPDPAYTAAAAQAGRSFRA